MEMWKINSYLKELKKLDDELEMQEESIELEITRLQNWLDNEKDRIAKEKEFYERELETAIKLKREEDPKYIIRSPYGQVSTRKQRPKFKYDDLELLNWAKNNREDLVEVETVEKVNKNEIKKLGQVYDGKLVTEDGEVIEGVEVEEREEVVTIKLGE